jgi:hypothetical protein
VKAPRARNVYGIPVRMASSIPVQDTLGRTTTCRSQAGERGMGGGLRSSGRSSLKAQKDREDIRTRERLARYTPGTGSKQ